MFRFWKKGIILYDTYVLDHSCSLYCTAQHHERRRQTCRTTLDSTYLRYAVSSRMVPHPGSTVFLPILSTLGRTGNARRAQWQCSGMNNAYNPLAKPKKDPSAASKVQNGAKAAYWGYKAFQALAVRTHIHTCCAGLKARVCHSCRRVFCYWLHAHILNSVFCCTVQYEIHENQPACLVASVLSVWLGVMWPICPGSESVSSSRGCLAVCFRKWFLPRSEGNLQG